MDENIVLTTQEVADMLKIAKNTVYELIKRGELNSYRVGKKVRFDLKDIEEYKNKSKNRKSNIEKTEDIEKEEIIIKTKSIPSAPDIHAEPIKQSSFILCGQDMILDILSSHLQLRSKGVTALRSYYGSYNGLYELYHGNVQMTTVHLWDAELDQYNVSYVKRMLPGVSAVIVHLATRLQGFYVKKGNPKGIKGWEDLKRNDIVMINREKGSGTRILLDGHLRKLGVFSNDVKGYQRESTSHLAIASTVARGGADIGLGNEKSALQVTGIDFIPLQTESLELVMRKEDIYKAPFQLVLEILNSKEFKEELQGIGGYNLDFLGKIVAET